MASKRVKNGQKRPAKSKSRSKLDKLKAKVKELEAKLKVKKKPKPKVKKKRKTKRSGWRRLNGTKAQYFSRFRHFLTGRYPGGLYDFIGELSKLTVTERHIVINQLAAVTGLTTREIWTAYYSP